MSVFTRIRANWSAPQGYREVLRVGLPLFASMATSMVMFFTDRLFLSLYSMEAIAAATPASNASMVVHMGMFGICSYTGVLAAQYVGARAFNRVGSAIWQGLWCSLFCGVILLLVCLLAAPLFELVGHEPDIQKLEVEYFVVITAGSMFGLISASISGFFYGLGRTKPVMLANMCAALINIPLDYVMIFGFGPVPELGIVGAGLATVCGWILVAVILACLVFSRKHDAVYHTRRGWRLEPDMFKRLVRFGTPSGVNLMVEFAGITWFMFQIGTLGKVPLAASNIAYTLSGLAFVPMLGLNVATATLVGQAMGRRKPDEAVRITRHALQLGLFYMISVAALITIFAGPLMEIFRTSGAQSQDYDAVKQLGTVLLYYVAVYSVADAPNLIFTGALKGAGDTMAVMKIIVFSVITVLMAPMLILRLTDQVGLHSMWICFTGYILFMTTLAALRFRGRKWQRIRVVEEAPEE